MDNLKRIGNITGFYCLGLCVLSAGCGIETLVNDTIERALDIVEDSLSCHSPGGCLPDPSRCESSGTCGEFNSSIAHEAECESDLDCDGGTFCNGIEECERGQCFAGVDPCLDGEVCDEARDSCIWSCLDDGTCDDGLFCTGIETCGDDGLCVSGGDPCGENELCNEDTDECEPESKPQCNSDADCSDGLFCNGDEECRAGVCVSVAGPCATYETCDEQIDSCGPIPDCSKDSDCPEDGLFCNGHECCSGQECHSTGNPCEQTETCDELADECIPAPCRTDSDCADDETCNPMSGDCELVSDDDQEVEQPNQESCGPTEVACAVGGCCPEGTTCQDALGICCYPGDIYCGGACRPIDDCIR